MRGQIANSISCNSSILPADSLERKQNHAPNCRGATATSEKNRVAFRTMAEAEAAGYRKAKDCR